MFEAFHIGCRISLINQVSPALFTLSRQFSSLHKDQEKANDLLTKMQRLTMVGAATGGAGLFGLAALSKMVKPAEEYVHQLNIMNMAGMKQAEIAQAVGAAWKEAGDNVTTTATGNLKALLDLRNVTGSMQEALTFMPIMQRMQTVLAASREGHVSAASGDLAFSAMKALDIRGAVNDPANLRTQADMMTKVIEATQGRVTPQMFQLVFQYARQGKFALSDQFAYQVLPTLMLESATNGGGGGGSRGVGPGIAALYRLTNQGYIDKKSLPLLAELGLVRPGTQLHTTTSGTTVGPMRDASMAAQNPFEWATTVVKPAVEHYLASHHMALSTQNILQVVGEMFRGNQLAASLMGEFIVKEQNFRRDQRLIEGTMSPDAAYRAAMTRDPNTAHRALHSAWENFETSLTMNVVPVIVPALLDLSKALSRIGEIARNHPRLAEGTVLGLAGLAATLAVGGPLLAAVANARLAFGVLPGVVAGSVTALGGLATAIGWVAAAGAAFVAAYKAGNWIEGGLQKTWVGRADDWLDKHLLGINRAPELVMATHGGSPYVAGRRSQPLQVTTQLNIEGRRIAAAVSNHMAMPLGTGLTGGGIDPNVALPQPGIR